MVRSEAAKKADAKYKAKNTRQLVIRFYPADADILAHLEAQGNKQGYIKRLIAEDMRRDEETSNRNLEQEKWDGYLSEHDGVIEWMSPRLHAPSAIEYHCEDGVTRFIPEVND